MKNFTIHDRDGNQIATGEEYEIAGEENQLWREGDGEGEFRLYGDQMRPGDERDFVWIRQDGSEVTVGSITCT